MTMQTKPRRSEPRCGLTHSTKGTRLFFAYSASTAKLVPSSLHVINSVAQVQGESPGNGSSLCKKLKCFPGDASRGAAGAHHLGKAGSHSRKAAGYGEAALLGSRPPPERVASSVAPER